MSHRITTAALAACCLSLAPVPASAQRTSNHHQAIKKPSSKLASTARPVLLTLPEMVTVDIPSFKLIKTGELNIMYRQVEHHSRPSMDIDAVLRSPVPPIEPLWFQFYLADPKTQKSVFEFASLVGVQLLPGVPTNASVADVGNGADVLDDGTLTIKFKTVSFVPQSGPAAGQGQPITRSPIVISDHKGDVVADGVSSITYRIRRQAPVKYTVADLFAPGRQADNTKLFFLTALHFPQSGKPVIEEMELRRIWAQHPIRQDINDDNVAKQSWLRQKEALTQLINRKLASWDESLYEVLEPQNDVTNEPRKPMFFTIRLPAHEANMAFKLRAMLKSGSKGPEVAVYRAMTNRVLLDRLLYNVGVLTPSRPGLMGLVFNYTDFNRRLNRFFVEWMAKPNDIIFTGSEADRWFGSSKSIPEPTALLAQKLTGPSE